MTSRGGARGFVAAALATMLLMPGTGLADGRDLVRDLGLLWLPDAPPAGEPMPVVVAIHDTTGIDARGWRYAEQITAAGIAVLHVDLLDTSAEDGGPGDPAADAGDALDRLRVVSAILAADPRFASAPVGLLAFGGAGETAIRAATDPEAGGRVAGLALLYPGCAGLQPGEGRAPRAPVLLLHGDADPANAPADCIALAVGLARLGPVRRIEYAGAGYAWDLTPSGQYEVPNLPWPRRAGQRVGVRHWPQGAELSATQVASFFAARLALRDGAQAGPEASRPARARIRPIVTVTGELP
ncbi:hypothetical protein J5Y09_10220 [Roseomonas sp. PWR1]|uniref:Dienelactone hydrolase n=1 Tax=Roseomonas nitratireducens TaxID=2820810 RepID=A0ABS4ASE9_9PROT|nr:hypothetical protein [Neoroseomonas nitratireducens]MBP0464289.1 hypothetical protein [Neoroseomonas nitratireducens]